MSVTRSPAIVGLSTLLLFGCTKATLSSTEQLKSANATLAAEFSWAGSVRELSDGRVLIVDEKENRLMVADSAFRAASEIGRQGDGPGEFRTLGRIWAIHGDSSLIADPNVHRWTIVAGIHPVETIPPSDPAAHVIGAGYGWVVGTDSGSAVIGQIFSTKSRNINDSMFLVRTDRATGRADSLTRLRSTVQGGDEGMPGGGAAAGKPKYSVALALNEEAVGFSDGWIAVARVDPYRIDWCAPGRQCVAGPVLDRSRPMTVSEKRAYLAYTAKTTKWPPTSDLAATFDWPVVLPPFVDPSSAYQSSPLLSLPDGTLLVERLPSAAVLDRRYDVVNREGKRVRQIQVPLNQRIIGAGRDVVYVATTDEDGVQRLSRHPWP